MQEEKVVCSKRCCLGGESGWVGGWVGDFFFTWIKDDLPQPVRPTMPTRAPPGMEKERPLRTKGRPWMEERVGGWVGG